MPNKKMEKDLKGAFFIKFISKFEEKNLSDSSVYPFKPLIQNVGQQKRTMIKAIIFDLDQTLIDRGATFTKFIEEQHKRFISRLGNFPRQDFVEAVFLYDNNGYTEKSELYKLVCEQLKIKSISSKELFNDFKTNYGQNPVLFVAVYQTLGVLKKNYKLGLITNGRSKGQNSKITRSKIRDYFCSIKISEEEGVKKPDQKIFENCLQELGVKANESVFVGDHPINDVEAAKQVGMLGIWVKNENYETPEKHDGIIENLSELPKLLETIKSAQQGTRSDA